MEFCRRLFDPENLRTHRLTHLRTGRETHTHAHTYARCDNNNSREERAVQFSSKPQSGAADKSERKKCCFKDDWHPHKKYLILAAKIQYFDLLPSVCPSLPYISFLSSSLLPHFLPTLLIISSYSINY